MKYVILADNTRINGCTDSTTSNAIYAERDSYEQAGAVRDLFTAENAAVIRVFNSDDTEAVAGANLVLLDGCKISAVSGKYVVEINTRYKTDTEVLTEEVAELQEAVLG